MLAPVMKGRRAHSAVVVRLQAGVGHVACAICIFGRLSAATCACLSFLLKTVLEPSSAASPPWAEEGPAD